MVGMVSHCVSLLHHAFHQFRGRLQVMPHHEKGSRSIVLLQRIQNRTGVAVFIPTIKGQIQHLLLAFRHIVGVILLHLVNGGISGWLRPCLSKSKPPVFRLGQEFCLKTSGHLHALPRALLRFSAGHNLPKKHQRQDKNGRCCHSHCQAGCLLCR